jgi:gluconolactonase
MSPHSPLALSVLLLIASASTAAEPAAAPNATAEGVVASGATLQKIAGDFLFTEGPAADADGNVYFTDQPNDRIHKWTAADNQVAVFLTPSGRSNGLFIDHTGHLLACADLKNELWSIPLAAGGGTVPPDPTKIAVLVRDYQGKLLNGPNDLWVRPDNGVYLTDPLYKRPYWARGPMEQDGQHVYFVSPDRKSLTRVAADLTQPNGIIGTPDGRTLYVADIGVRKTFRYDIQADGSLTGKALFCEMGSDGMTIDTDGNVYLTGKGVTVFDKTGRQIDHIDVPEPWTGNVTFGGKDRKLLFITASKSVYGISTRVAGAR